ncbi:anionic trypsin-2-like [Cheilinus undulatus]|uniref:anionic trypsin-2-like n=1 Tax=Cheilinus undulatus TaxID=241271 RepID=UPI001BD61E62|nr:anionic trypsin-2-like [Cheilinus undulatus]
MGDMARLLLLLWAGVLVSRAVDLQKRIIGGGNCRKDDRGYHVFVKGYDGTDDFMCGGSLISDQWILTASHCLQAFVTVYLDVHPGQLVLKNGIPIQSVTQVKIYNDSNGYHDIMLVKLPNRTNIRPIKLPSDSECRASRKKVQIAGYGATTMGPNNERGNDTPTTLQCADIPVVNCAGLNTHMQNKYPAVYQNKLYQHWFCGHSSTTCTSGGDSGGGVVHNCRIYGVISFHGNHTHACVEPAGFMDVCNPDYKKWIKDTCNNIKKLGVSVGLVMIHMQIKNPKPRLKGVRGRISKFRGGNDQLAEGGVVTE